MTVLDFGIEVIAISASGVLAPGPLFFTNLFYGSKHGARSGLEMAYGHTLVELPLVVLLGIGLFTSAAVSQYTGTIGLIGGIGIIVFGAIQIQSIVWKRSIKVAPKMARNKCPIIAGVALSALNPFFLVWWFTVGLKLIADSAIFGFVAGITILFVLHIWMDYAWLTSTAFVASKGNSVLNSKYYPLLLLAIVGILLYYGILFIQNSIR